MREVVPVAPVEEDRAFKKRGDAPRPERRQKPQTGDGFRKKMSDTNAFHEKLTLERMDEFWDEVKQDRLRGWLRPIFAL